ncbi:MAG TPA: hypothetical protein VEI57_02020 [Nitrospirota bacterium]|nr:hypothetical protein [Nitrospirota bacterium]
MEAKLCALVNNKFKQDGDRTQITRVIPVHREWTKQLLAEGILVQTGKWGGMIIMRAESMSEAEKIVD